MSCEGRKIISSPAFLSFLVERMLYFAKHLLELDLSKLFCYASCIKKDEKIISFIDNILKH